jgi:Tol biopolymer transport system component
VCVPHSRVSTVCRSLLTVVLVAASIGIDGVPSALATVSGEAGMIAFVSGRDGNSEIYLMESDGSNPVNLTNHPASDFDPNWSPDGRQIVFVSDRDGSHAIYVMNGDGTGQTRIVAGGEPEWSPDGKSIAFARNGSIYVLRLGGAEHRVTDPLTATGLPDYAHSVADASPAWSPDGSRIAFVRHFSGGSPMAAGARLYLTDPNSLAPPTLLASVGPVSRDPDWSPDGTRIVIEDVPFHGIWSYAVVVNTDGSGTIDLPVPDGFDHVSNPVWSPDGVSLAASLWRMMPTFTPGDIFVMKVDGSNPVNLTDDPAYDGSPAWQPLNPYPVGLVDPGTGIWHLRDVLGKVTSFYYGNPGDVPFMGDWNCDGVDTPGLYRQSDGYVYLRNSNTQGIANIRFFFGNPGDMPIAGDFNGDGCDTVSIYRPSEGRFYIINELGSDGGGLGAAEYSYLFGNPGDKPFVGDFNGNGVDTVGLHRESTGLVYIRNSNTQGIADQQFFYGNPGDRLVAYDWNGDGVESPAVYRPDSQTFYFRFTNSQGVADARYIFGESAWLPVAGSLGGS